MQQTPNLRAGAMMMIISAFSFALMQTVVSMTAGTIPLMEQVFVRNLISLGISIFVCRRRKVPLFGTKADQLPLLGRSIFGFIAVISLFAALSGATQGDVAIISKLNPFFVTLIAVLLLHERVNWVQIASLFLAFGGALLVVQPSMDSNPVPLLFALLNAISTGMAYPLISYMSGKVDPFTIVAYFSGFSCVCSGIIMLATQNYVVPDALGWALLFGIGIFAAGGQIFVTLAYRLAPASQISILDYVGILFSLLCGTIFLKESIAATSAAGAVLVIAAALLSYCINRKNAEQNK